MKRTLPIVVLTLLAAVLLNGCGSSRKLAGATAQSGSSNWTTLYAPVNLRLEKPASMSMSGRATMCNGQYVHFSMRVIGMEVAAVYLDADSAFFVDKYHRYLFAEPLKDILGSKYDYLTLSDIQQIILGTKKLKSSDNVSIEASDFVSTVAGEIASRLSVNAHTAQGDIKASLDWNPAVARWDEPNRSVDFKVPANYTRISAESLRSILKSTGF